MTFFVPDVRYLHGFWSTNLVKRPFFIFEIRVCLSCNFLLLKSCKYLKSGTKKVKNIVDLKENEGSGRC
jgi:hypothetical protein